VKEVRNSSHNAKRQNHPTSVITIYTILMMIGMPILLAFSAIAALPSSAIQLVYGQGQPTGEQQQEINNLNFQTANVTLDGTTYPVKYNITDNAAEVLSMAADKESFKLVITIAPTKDGKLTVMIPRNLTDFKVAGGKDGKFVVNMNAKQAPNFQEISNNQTTRGLEVNFGKDDRVIEIVGTQMGQADISKIKEQAIEATPTVRSNASGAAANASKTGGSIVNQTGEAVQTFVNKTTGILGNISGEILGSK
jgi:hypothetical protein